MGRILKVLAALLVVQVALAVVTWWPRGSGEVEVHPLVDLSADAVDRVVISGDPKATTKRDPVELVKKDGQWVIASKDDFPADPAKVRELVQRFTEARVGRPIATRPTSHAALEVAEDTHKRKVVLGAGSESVTLLVGSATSRSVHVRRADQDDVYRLKGFSVWSIADQPRSYWDPKVLDLDPETVTSLHIRGPKGDFELVRDGADQPWRLSDQQEGEELDTEAVDRLVRKAATLRMVEPVAREAKPEHGLDEGVVVEWTVTEDDQTRSGSYRIGATEEYRTYVQPEGGWVVQVSKSAVKDLVDATRDGLLKKDEGA